MAGTRGLLLRVALGAFLLCLVVGGVAYVVLSKDEVAAANIVGGIAGTGALAVAIVALIHQTPRETRTEDERADIALAALQHEVRRFWTDEAEDRHIVTPATIMVSWEWTLDRSLAAAPEEILATRVPREARGVRRRAKNRLLTAGVVTELRDLYVGLPTSKMAILGEAGAGKTAALILILLSIVEDRDRQGVAALRTPLPVLLPIGDWEADRISLRSWAADRIVQDNPFLRAAAYGPSVVSRLLDSGKLALFLDGLDEMPDSMRPTALAALTRETSVPIVVTSRPDEWAKAVRDYPVTTAAVVRLLPVDVRTAGGYLRHGHLGQMRSEWEIVAAYMAKHPESAVAEALSTPLMLTLARSTYRAGDSPSALVDSEAFPSAAAVRRHLIGQVIPNAYRDTGARPEISRYLEYIAMRMSRESEARELVWWRIRRWRPWIPPIVATLLLATAGALSMVPNSSPEFAVKFGAAWAASGILISAAIAALAGGVQRDPLSGAVPRTIVALGCGVIFGAGTGLIAGLGDGHMGGSGWSIALGATFGAVMGVIVGLVTLHDGPLVAGVRRPLPDDIAGAAVAGVIAGTIFAVASGEPTGLLIGLIEATGYIAAVSWSRPSESPQARMTPSSSYEMDIRGAALFAITGGLAIGAGVAIALLPTHTFLASVLWGAVVGTTAAATGAATSSQAVALGITGVALRVTGHSPARMMRFLEDARRRNVLRCVGTRYQFRHAELQDFLANRMRA